MPTVLQQLARHEGGSYPRDVGQRRPDLRGVLRRDLGAGRGARAGDRRRGAAQLLRAVRVAGGGLAAGLAQSGV
jgi:hypothetical protein